MEKTVYIVLALIALAALGVVQTNKAVTDDLSTPGMTTVSEDLGSEPSEDASHLLQFPDLAEYTYPFSPAPEIEYLVYLKAEERLTNREVLKVYNQLQEEMDGWFLLYGRVEDQWTIPRESLGAMITYDELVVSQMMVDYEGNPGNAEDFQRINQLATRFADEFNMIVDQREAVESAVDRAQELSDFWRQYDQWILLVLKAEEGDSFSGSEVHDVAQSLGLEWDDDAKNYVWMNEDDRVGDVFLFNLANLDGYDFYPEKMVKGDYTVPGVIFGFYLPTSGAPKAVYDNMRTAVNYFQQRLGGVIEDHEGRVLDEEYLEWIGTVIEEMEHEMTEAGFTPGHNLALWLYEVSWE